MNKRLNKKGFTLVELIAVLVILGTITAIAIPKISSSLERTKNKQNQARYKIIESSAEQYVTDYKNAIYKKLETNNTNSCYIQINNITYLSDDDKKDADGNDVSNNYIIFTKPNNYKYTETKPNTISCI